MGMHQGIRKNAVPVDMALVNQLERNHMEQLAPVPKTIMGTVAQPDEPWLRMDAIYPEQMHQRFCVLSRYKKFVIDREEGRNVRIAELELRDTVVSYLTTTYPDYFHREEKTITSPLTGFGVNLAQANPLQAVAMLTNADMLLMMPSEPDGQGGHYYRLMSGALLSPNYWSLRSRTSEMVSDKVYQSRQAARLGKTVQEIHKDIVPHFDVHLSDRVHRLFNTLPTGRVIWRRNWGLPLTDRLYLHPDSQLPQPPELTPANMYAHGHVRSEHETFIRLPHTRAIVFGIQTYIWPIKDMLASPKVFNALATAMDNTSPEMRAYGDRAEKLDTLRQLMASRPGTGQAKPNI